MPTDSTAGEVPKSNDDTKETKSSSTQFQEVSGEETELERVLGKYVQVWLFSIQFGALSAVSFSSFYLRAGDLQRWGLIGVPVSICILISAFAALMAWVSLAKYFRGYLVQSFLLKRPSDRDIGGELLSQSMRYLVFAITFRLLASVLDTLLQTLSFL